ncbi:MAG: response regulator [Candidatus Competibacteraceae bacterium]|nr:response regulator [Candidatus Competibacteraceae bacterium]
MRKQVVFVEDDDVIRENYTELLTDEGFEVTAFSDPHAALAHVSESMPNLALLDISLKTERDAGFQLCADLRHLSAELPIVFLTSHDSEMDKISGIRLGADDYLTKDVSLNYLVIRLEALLRRFQGLARIDAANDCAKAKKFIRGPLAIDCDNFTVSWRGQTAELNMTQFKITQELAAHPGQVRNYDKLMKAASIHVEPNTITAHIKAIRDRFRAIDANFDNIRTERGMGYRWIEAA